jgi:Flp pilus assembly protein TadG
VSASVSMSRSKRCGPERPPRTRSRRVGRPIRLREDRGQALILSIAFLTVLLVCAAAVLDVGAWYRQHRQLQATADAAALAGAQGLRDGNAVALAVQYAGKNGGGVTAGDVTLSMTKVPNDTIAVRAKKPTPGVFTKLFGINSVTVKATAKAQAGIPGQVRWAAPIAVDERHPMLSGPGCPCWGQPTSLDLLKVGPGAFRLINIDRSRGGTGPSTVADWILRGYAGWMPLDWYFSDSGAKFDSSQIKSAMTARLGDELLFPIYRETRGQGSNFDYFVVGWAGFHVTGFDAKGNGGEVYGWFESVIWEGILSETADADNDFGVRSVQLVE